MAKFQFPDRRTILEYEQAGKLMKENIGKPACDFCYDRRVRYEVPVRPFEVKIAGSTGFASDDDWAACKRCAFLVKLKAWTELEERVYQSWIELGKRKRDVIRPRWHLTLLLLQVADHITGPVRPYSPKQK